MILLPQNVDGNRRSQLVGLGSILLNIMLGGHAPANANSGVCRPVSQVSIDECANWICVHTPPQFRRAIRKSRGRFVYRGSDDTSGRVYVDSSEPDLLIPDTYNDPSALTYFNCLEQSLPIDCFARPSEGHIVTTNPRVAAQWGSSVVSVWPLGDTFSFVWAPGRETLYPGGSCPSEKLMVDSHLDDALWQRTEILFASKFSSSEVLHDANSPTGDCRQDIITNEMVKSRRESSFLAVPVAFDNRLRVALEQLRYGL